MTREEFMQEFVDRLNMIKNDMDVSCLDIEREAGIPRNCVASYTRGATTPNLYKFVLLCEYFGVSADWLLGLSDDMGREV
jgi:hypothetical protein